MDLSCEDRLEHASLVRPCPGEWVSGDAVVVCSREGRLLVSIVDVLGHGPEANELANEIEAYLLERGKADVSETMNRLDERVRGSRGAAVGLCAIDAESGRLIYVGTGNTVLRRFGRQETRLVSQDGVLGQNMRTPRPQTLNLEANDLVVLYTDGIKDRFSSDDYPGVLRHPPKEAVATILARFGKDHDDAACIAVRYRK